MFAWEVHPLTQASVLCISSGLITFNGVLKLIKNMKTHQMSKTRFYKIWKGIICRCNNKNHVRFKDYGGRGIKVCERWQEFENFRDDMLSKYKNNLSIDRIDNNGNYELKNCRWATVKQQNKNKRMKKLSFEKVKEIRQRYKKESGVILAKEYGVTKSVISEIVNHKRNYARK